MWSALVALIVAGGAAWLAQKTLGITSDGVVIAILVIPLLVYGIVGGVIEELSAPGGWKARFRSEARRPALMDITLEEVQPVPKAGIYELVSRVAAVGPNTSPVLLIEIGGRVQYAPAALRDYLDNLSKHPLFRFVVFVDENRRLLGHVPYWSIMALLQDSDLAMPLIHSWERGEFGDRLRLLPPPPGEPPTLLEALRQMDQSGIDALLVVDQTGRLRGIVHRDVVLTRLMLALGENIELER
jgi:CBS domain-containing protein